MAVIDLVDQAEYLISTGDDPTTLTSNIDQTVAAGTVASTVQMLVMPPSKFTGYVGGAHTAIGHVPGNPATGGVTQYAVYVRSLTFDASGAPLSIGKFAYLASSPVGS
jgi:hypothetical protein